jgi:hypothetical protein
MWLIIFFLIISILLIYKLSIKPNYSTYVNPKGKPSENTIWTYWDQGTNKLLPLHILCIATWKKKNPNHDIIVVDQQNIFQYIDQKDLPVNWQIIDSAQPKSDFVRLALLEKHGGVWMDITTICIKPLNSVFTQTKSIEGFALKSFSRKDDLSVFESWFITAKKSSRIIKKWKDTLIAIFGNSTSMSQVDQSYFNDMDLQKISRGPYLTIHRVLMKLNQNDPEIKNLYYNDSNILPAEDTAFLHYKTFSFDLDVNKLFEKNDSFIDMVDKSNTPIIKFISAGGELKNMDEKQLLGNKSSVIYKLFNY